jgi:hypothetical protein
VNINELHKQAVARLLAIPFSDWGEADFIAGVLGDVYGPLFDEIDRLTAEKSRLKAAESKWENDQALLNAIIDVDCEKHKELSALRQRVAELELDANRYRWLRDDNASEVGQPWCVTRYIDPPTVNEEPAAITHDALDAAIDAAMEQQT